MTVGRGSVTIAYHAKCKMQNAKCGEEKGNFSLFTFHFSLFIFSRKSRVKVVSTPQESRGLTRLVGQKESEVHYVQRLLHSVNHAFQER